MKIKPLIQNIKNQRMIIVILSVLVVVLSIVSITVYRQNRKTAAQVEIIDIDPQSGDYIITNPIGQVVISENVRKKTIEDFIISWRSVSPIYEENQENVKRTFEFAEDSVQQFLTHYYTEENENNSPFVRSQYVKVAVEIEDLHKLEGSENEYEVTWQERTYGVQTSKLLEERRYSGYVTINVYGPNPNDTYEFNTLHIFINRLNFGNK